MNNPNSLFQRKVVSTSRATVKPGMIGTIVSVDSITVYLGKECIKTEMAIFQIAWDIAGKRPYITDNNQVGRDFVISK